MTGLSGAQIARNGLSGDVERALSNALDVENRLYEIMSKLGIPQAPSSNSIEPKEIADNLANKLSSLNIVISRNQNLTAMILKGL